MKHRKILIWLLTGLCLAVAMLAGYVSWSQQKTVLPLSLQVGGTEVLQPWQERGDEYCFFLPDYAEPSQAVFRWDRPGTLTIGGVPVEDGMSCDGFPLDTPLEVLWNRGTIRHSFTLTILPTGNLPTMYVDVKSGTMDYIHQERNNKEAGRLRLYDADGNLLQALDLAHVETRGNSTIHLLKKSYNLMLNQETELLGMGAAKRWVMLSNGGDDSHARVRAIYEFAREMGLAYSPESRWVDLYLNGNYVGVYLLCERNEVHPQRVALTGEGSFLVSKEWEWRMEKKDQHFVMTQNDTALRVHYSDLDDDGLTAALQSVENAILAPDNVDSVTGKHLTELIDLDSWVKKYLIEEVFGNVDGLALSQFFYRDGEGKVFAGPVWDYDLTMGNGMAYPVHAPNMFFANRAGLHGSSWYPALYRNPLFYDRMVEIYRDQFLPALETLLQETLPAYETYLSGAAWADARRWSNPWVIRDPVEETDWILQYMEGRIGFLDRIWLEEAPYHTVLVKLEEGVVICYMVSPGDCLPELPPFADTPEMDYQGWFLEGADTPFDVTQPILEDLSIYLRAVPIPPEQVEEPFSPLRYGPAVLFVLLLPAVFLWDRRRNCPPKTGGRKEKAAP